MQGKGIKAAACIGQHGKGDTALHHFGKLIVVPHFVHKHAVDTDGQNLNAQLLECFIFFGNCRYFRGSDEGEIPGIKAHQYPLA
jgi:hypothetical protein